MQRCWVLLSKYVPICLALASCYRPHGWYGSSEYRGKDTHVGEHESSWQRVIAFHADNGLSVSVMRQPMCEPTLVGDHLEQKETTTRHLHGEWALIASGVLLGVGGLVGVLVAVDDTSSKDMFGRPRSPTFSSTTQHELEIGGGLAAIIGIGEIVLSAKLPFEKPGDRWTVLAGNPPYVVTGRDLHVCETVAQTPIAAVPVHVSASFARSSRRLEWDLVSDASGRTSIDLSRAARVAGWCGEANATVTVDDEHWSGNVAQQPTPLASIEEGTAHEIATQCADVARTSCLAEISGPDRDQIDRMCLVKCAERADVQRCALGARVCLARSESESDDSICEEATVGCLFEEGIENGVLQACQTTCKNNELANLCKESQ